MKNTKKTDGYMVTIPRAAIEAAEAWVNELVKDRDYETAERAVEIISTLASVRARIYFTPERVLDTA